MELQARSWRRKASLGVLVAGIVATGLPSAPAAARRDSVAVRLYYTDRGGELESCAGLNWGWDSLTRRLSPGDWMSVRFASEHFVMGSVISPDSAWLAYPTKRLVWDSQGYKPSDYREPNWVLLTTRPAAFETYGIKDATLYYRVKLVTPWPEPATRPIKTTTLRGRVVDDSTGCVVGLCEVVIDWTKCSALTDTLGRFVLHGVPEGQVGVTACAYGYLSDQRSLRAPQDSLVIRLRHDPQVTFRQPCWGRR